VASAHDPGSASSASAPGARVSVSQAAWAGLRSALRREVGVASEMPVGQAEQGSRDGHALSARPTALPNHAWSGRARVVITLTIKQQPDRLLVSRLSDAAPNGPGLSARCELLEVATCVGEHALDDQRGERRVQLPEQGQVKREGPREAAAVRAERIDSVILC
jgi:hypothetical protein